MTVFLEFGNRASSVYDDGMGGIVTMLEKYIPASIFTGKLNH